MSSDRCDFNLSPYPSDHPVVPRTYRREISDIAGRYVAADERLRRARSAADREAAEDDRRQAMGDLWACREELSGLLLLMLRCAAEHDPGALRSLLSDVMRPDLDALAGAVARMEEST